MSDLYDGLSEAEILALIDAENSQAPKQQIPQQASPGTYRGPSFSETLADKGLAGLNALASGFGDEIATTASSVVDKIKGDSRPFSQVVLDNSNKYSQATKEARENEPIADILGSVFSPSPLKGGNIAKAAQSAGYQALRGLGNSDGDPTLGGIAGNAAGGALGYGVGAGLSKVAKINPAMKEKYAAAIEKLREKMAKKAQDAMESARGALGGRSQAVLQNFDVIKNAASRTDIPDELRAAMQALLNSEVAKQAELNALQNKAKIQDLGLSALTAARGEFDEAVGKTSADAVAAATKGAADNWVKETVTPRFMRYIVDRAAQNLIPMAVGGALVGAVAPDSLPGKALGTGIGLAAGLAVGKPGTSIGNLANNPAFQAGMANLGAKMSYLPSKAAEGVGKISDAGFGGVGAGASNLFSDAIEEYLKSKQQ